MARFPRLAWLFALLIGSAMAVQAQDIQARTRDDDGGRPEEDNISGHHDSPSDAVIFHQIVLGTGTEGGGTDVDGNSDSPERVQPGTLNLGSQLDVFPNPTSRYLDVTFGDTYSVVVSLHNLVGKETYRFQGITDKHRIDVRDFAPGIYFVNIVSGEQREVRKVKITH